MTAPAPVSADKVATDAWWPVREATRNALLLLFAMRDTIPAAPVWSVAVVVTQDQRDRQVLHQELRHMLEIVENATIGTPASFRHSESGWVTVVPRRPGKRKPLPPVHASDANLAMLCRVVEVTIETALFADLFDDQYPIVANHRRRLTASLPACQTAIERYNQVVRRGRAMRRLRDGRQRP